TYSLTSAADPDYNCIAWAAGDSQRVWWPAPSPYAYWPPNVSLKEAVDAFAAAFATLGYSPCPDGSVEAGYEKVAIFVSKDGKPTHAARQLPGGTWTSKLGKGGEDISHSLYGLEGGAYGDVALHMKRPIPPTKSIP
ncbi:MAG: DUF7689 domain-containing protein, partial [Gemmatimonadales bacterium]